MIPKLYRLRDGMRLYVCPTHKFKSANLSLSAVLPLTGERPWMTTLLLAVLRRGCEKYPTLAALNRRLDYLYGTELSIRNFFRGDSQIIGFSAEFLEGAYLPAGADPVRDALEVMTSLLFHPLLDEDGLLSEKYVESEKKLHCDGIRSLQNNPRAYAGEHCRLQVYRDEPSGASPVGSVEEIMAVTPRQLTDHWRRLMNEISLDFFYVGGEDGTAVGEKIESAIVSPLLTRPMRPSALQLAPAVFKDQTLRLDEELEVSQGQLVIALRTPVTLTHPLYPALLLYNEILGGSPVSKLFMNVRERLSLCYHCASSFNSYKGTVMIFCGLEPSNRQRAEAAIMAELEAIKRGGFDESELEAAVRSLSHSYRQLADSPGALEGYYYGRSLMGISRSYTEALQDFARVTRKDIIEVAKTLQIDTVYFLNGTLKGGEWYEED